MAEDLSTLTLEVNGEDAIRTLDRYEKTARASHTGTSLLNEAVRSLGAAFSVAITIRKFIDETSSAQAAQAQLEAAIRSTGGAAGRSVQSLQAVAEKMQALTSYSDEAVQGVQALLLTFRSIKGDTFDDATSAVLDLATRMGGDLNGAALQVGKALQDPADGLTALRRSGVSFSDAQTEVIRNLAETNRLAEAQALILAELNTEFGGSAAAARDTLGGALKGLSNDFGELFEVSRTNSGGAIGAINGLAGAIRNVNDALTDGDVLAVVVRELGNLINGVVIAARVFAEWGNQIDATGEKINGLTDLVGALSNFDGKGMTAALDRIRAGNDAVGNSLERVNRLLAEGRAAEYASRNAPTSASGVGARAALNPATGGGGSPLLQGSLNAGLFGPAPLDNVRVTAQAKAAAAATETLSDAQRKLAEQFAKAASAATIARDRQLALNSALGFGANSVDEINARFDLKAKLAAVDAEFTGKQATALRALAVQLDALTKIARDAAASKAADATIDEARLARQRTEASLTKEVTDRLAALKAQREAGTAVAAKELEGLQRQIDTFGKTGAELQKLTESYLLADKAAQYAAGGMDVLSARVAAQKFVEKQREVDALNASTIDWGDTLRDIAGVIQLLTTALEAMGVEGAKALAQAATGAQSVLSGASKAGEIKNAAGQKVGLGGALTGAAGAAGVVSGLGAAGAVVGGLAQIADALDLFGSKAAARRAELQKLAEDFNAALGEFGRDIKDRAVGDFQQARNEINAMIGALANGAALAAGFSGENTKNLRLSAEDVAAYIADLQKQSKALLTDRNPFNDAKGNQLAQFAESLKAVEERAKNAESALRAEQAAVISALTNDLKVRQLRAAGLDTEAEALAFANAQTTERESVMKKFAGALDTAAASAAIAELAITQQAEATKRAADEVKKAAEEQRRIDRSVTDTTLAARAFTDPRGASDTAFLETQRRRYEDAATAAEKLAVSAYNAAEAIDRQTQIAQRDQSTGLGLLARIAAATGDTRGSEDLTRFQSNQDELNQAIRDGMNPTNLVLLKFAQFSEASQVQMLRAIEDQTKVVRDRADNEIAANGLLIEAIRTDSARQIAAIDKRIASEQRAAADAAKAFDRQIENARSALDVAKAQLSELEKSVATNQRVVEALDGFLNSSRLGDLSTFSPLDKKAEATRQFDELLAKAQGGDTDAAGALPGAANALLQAARAFDGSTPAFAAIFDRVQAALAGVRDQFGATLPVDVQALDAARRTVTGIERSIQILQRAKEEAAAHAQATIDALNTEKDAIGLSASEAISQYEAQNDVIRAAADAEIKAIEAAELQNHLDRIEQYKATNNIEALTADALKDARAYYERIEQYLSTPDGERVNGGLVPNAAPIAVVVAPEGDSVASATLDEMRSLRTELAAQRAELTALRAEQRELLTRNGSAAASSSDEQVGALNRIATNTATLVTDARTRANPVRPLVAVR